MLEMVIGGIFFYVDRMDIHVPVFDNSIHSGSWRLAELDIVDFVDFIHFCNSWHVLVS